MNNWNCVGDSTRLLKHGLLGFLNEDFVDDTYDLPAFGVIQRATAVSRVSGGVELENIIRRREARENA